MYRVGHQRTHTLLRMRKPTYNPPYIHLTARRFWPLLPTGVAYSHNSDQRIYRPTRTSPPFEP